MRAVIANDQWIYLDNITGPEEDVIWASFSVSRDNQFVDPEQRGLWDGVYRKYNRAKRRLARPLLGMLRAVCHKHNLPLQIVDQRDPPAFSPMPLEAIDQDFLPGITLDDYQQNAIRKACSTECGIFEVPTGGGKGELIAGICKAIECPTVILADQTVVVDQLQTRLELREVTDKVGVFYAGKRPSGETIVVGSIQSLSVPSSPPQRPQRTPTDTEQTWENKEKNYLRSLRGYHTRVKNANSLRKYVKQAHMVIVDECDKATSKPWKSLFQHWFRGRRRYGFSGTPIDPDRPVEALTMQEHLGSIIVRETRDNLLAKNRIIDAEYIALAFGEDGNHADKTAYDVAFTEQITQNARFHQLVAAICKRHAAEANLILVDKIPLGEAILAALGDVGITANYIYGETPKRRRNDILRAFERREFNVLIGGKIINRGLDLRGGVDNLIIATGGKLWSDLMQKVGRALRRNARGSSLIYDFYFRSNHYLYGHSRARLRSMVDSGYKTTVVFRYGKIDGAELIRRRFRPPKAPKRDPA